MTEPQVIAVPYRQLRERIRAREHPFVVRDYSYYNVLFCNGLVICPANEAEDAVADLTLTLTGMATILDWEWIDPDQPNGDCIFVRITADANQ